MFNELRLAGKIFLLIITLSSFRISHGHPSHFFYYPEIQSLGDQSYFSIKYELGTKNFYPELNIIRMPGVAIRYMRSKNTLPDIAIRLIIRSPKSFKYSTSYRDTFATALSLQIVINQSWTSAWTTNNTNRKVIASSSGPCFETRATSISGLSTHLKPLLEGLKTATISSTELASTMVDINSNYVTADAADTAPTKMQNSVILPIISLVSTNEIGNAGDLIFLKGFLNLHTQAVYTDSSNPSAIQLTDVTAAIDSFKTTPMEFFIVSSQELIEESIVRNTLPIIQTHNPSPSHSIMYNLDSPGMATVDLFVSQSTTSTRAGAMLYSTENFSAESLIALEILEQHLFSISIPESAGDYKISWAPIAQVGWAVIYTGINCTASSSFVISGGAYNGTYDVDWYIDQVLINNFINTVTLSYLKDRLRSSWSDCLGSAQKRNKSLDAVIAINNNNVVDGFFTWMEEWYNKETELDDLYHIGNIITSNSNDFDELCIKVHDIISTMQTNRLHYRYSSNNRSANL